MASRLPYQPLPLEVPAGHLLLRQDERATTIWEVLSGAFVHRVRDADGRSLALDLAGPGRPTGSVPGLAAGWEVQAVCPGSVRRWAGPVERAMAGWTERSAAFACRALWLDVPARLEHLLEDLAERFGVPAPAGTRIALPLTHELMAELVGASRESVSRAISQLRSSGHIRSAGRGRIVVCAPLQLVPAPDRVSSR
ncbi:MAG: Crp/Fnr family transcriptional regulator [Actinomycetota bacterium]